MSRAVKARIWSMTHRGARALVRGALGGWQVMVGGVPFRLVSLGVGAAEAAASPPVFQPVSGLGVVVVLAPRGLVRAGMSA